MLLVFGLLAGSNANAAELELVQNVEHQPLAAACERLLEALSYVGAPLAEEDAKTLQAAMKAKDHPQGIKDIQKVLDKHCLAGVEISAESRVKVVEGPAKKELIQQGWRTFLVKVHNEAGITPKLVADSPNAAPLYMRGQGARQRPLTEQKLVPPGEVSQRFLDIAMFDRQPLKPTLSGLELEYRIIQLYSRDAGKREAQLAFNVGQGTQDIGFRNAVPLLFHCVPAVTVALSVRDIDGSPTTAAFVIRDKQGRIYPNPAEAVGSRLFLPQSNLSHWTAKRCICRRANIKSPSPAGRSIWSKPVPLQRAQKRGEHQGGFPIEALDASRDPRVGFREIITFTPPGCAHYDSPTEGVTPTDMMRHILGEDLNVGCVLSWGPCWYTQKQYFEGQPSALSRPNYLMRYDVEVSGFPSSHAGHLCLLRLKEDDYPGTDYIEQWPSWTLPVLNMGQEARRRGGLQP